VCEIKAAWPPSCTSRTPPLPRRNKVQVSRHSIFCCLLAAVWLLGRSPMSPNFQTHAQVCSEGSLAAAKASPPFYPRVVDHTNHTINSSSAGTSLKPRDWTQAFLSLPPVYDATLTEQAEELEQRHGAAMQVNQRYTADYGHVGCELLMSSHTAHENGIHAVLPPTFSRYPITHCTLLRQA